MNEQKLKRLPSGAVAIDRSGEVWQKIEQEPFAKWVSPYWHDDFSSKELLSEYGPLEVIYTGVERMNETDLKELRSMALRLPPKSEVARMIRWFILEKTAHLCPPVRQAELMGGR